jgi:hypothetical protein
MSLDETEKAQILSRIERLQKLLNDFERASATALERAKIRERMRQELEAARVAIRNLGTNHPT